MNKSGRYFALKMFQLFGTSVPPKYEYDVIKVDPVSGFSQFPDPDDLKKNSLIPVLIDYEEEERLRSLSSCNAENTNVQLKSADNVDILKNRDFWMPDNLVKVCFNCEELFTMYRRKHHCRICGQIFCHACSNYSIDGSYIHLPSGLVRVCRLCYDQIYELNNTNKDMFSSSGGVQSAKVVNQHKARSSSVSPVYCKGDCSGDVSIDASSCQRPKTSDSSSCVQQNYLDNLHKR